MNLLGNLLFPAQPLTGSLVLAACSGGFFVGVTMGFFRPIKSRLTLRLLRAAGFGGIWGLVACVLTLMMLDGSGARKLTGLELTASGVLAFLTGALVATLLLALTEMALARRANRSPFPPALRSPSTLTPGAYPRRR